MGITEVVAEQIPNSRLPALCPLFSEGLSVHWCPREILSLHLSEADSLTELALLQSRCMMRVTARAPIPDSRSLNWYSLFCGRTIGASIYISDCAEDATVGDLQVGPQS